MVKKGNIKAILNFYKVDQIERDRKFCSGMIVDFSIRPEMFNSGRIFFDDRTTVKSGEININSIIMFPHWNLILPYIKTGQKFIFGEIHFPYGEGLITEIL